MDGNRRSKGWGCTPLINIVTGITSFNYHPTLIISTPHLYFYFSRLISNCTPDMELKVWQHASAGAMTGVAASLFICPLELVKCRMQAIHQLCSTTGGPNYVANPQFPKTTYVKYVY